VFASRIASGENEMNGGFAAFHTLWDAIPFTEASAQLIFGCLDFYVRQSGKPIEAVERHLTLYKLHLRC
jgi:hypothetical protein